VSILTPRAVEAARPGRNTTGKAVRAEIPDGTGLGLYLAVEATGAKSWVVRYRDAVGRPKRRKLGGVHDMTLAAARAAAAAARHRAESAPGREIREQPVTKTAGDRIEDVAAQFLELHAFKKTKASTAETTERILNRLILPAWRGRTIHDVRRRDVIELVETIATARGGYMANRTLGHLSKWFSWMVARDMLDASPAAGVERPHVEEVRDRTLTDAEFRALWLAAEGDHFGPALRMLALVGARRNEISKMEWSEIDEAGTWTLPPARSKNGIAHTIGLSRQALAIVEAQPRLAGCPYVFPGRVGHGPLIGWAKAKSRISTKAGLDETSWRLHDLRRTCASNMQKLGVAVPTIEKCLNHTSGVFRGIVGTYQTHDYQNEIAVALQAWADRIDEIVAGTAARRV
jgi:integrase